MTTFERYTEKARRVIFFARYEAELNEHAEIELSDLLIGLCREWPSLKKVLNVPAFRPLATPRVYSSEPNFNEECRNALASAQARARKERVTHEHLLAAILEKRPALAEALSAKDFWEQELSDPQGLPQKDSRARSITSRIGLGYDYHRLVEGRKLILGGVEIPFSKGLAGHSDGDVLTHAICDALLGAAGLGDIGQHFPDTEPQWKGASSLGLLARVVELVRQKGFRIVNVDAVVIAEEPKLAPHFKTIREKLARALTLEPEFVSVKAKTTEGLEALGRGEAIAAQAVALLESLR